MHIITMKLHFLGIFLFSLLSINSFSQENQTLTKQEYIDLRTELDGVYQIQMINSRNKPALNSMDLLKIKELQKQNERVTLDISENVRVLILSKDDIAGNVRFTEEEKIIYIQ